jgi:uncharacterized protein (DUF427 family)
MAKAMWRGVVLADSNQTKIVEGNHYFPPESLVRRYLRPSAAHTVCSWKGVASYYDIVVNDAVNEQAAWYYAEPKPAAVHIKDHVAFWKGVEVSA